MSGNTFGQLFTVTTFGESHGPALGCVVDGCPPGLRARRRRTSSATSSDAARAPRATPASGASRTACGSCPASSRGARPARRSACWSRTTDQRSYDYEKIKDRFRPGPRRLHLPAEVRVSRLPRRRPLVGARDGDARGGRRDRAQVPGRAPGRRDLRLPRADGRDRARSCRTARPSTAIRSSAPIPRACRELEALIDELRREGDSIGARVTVVATGVPPGLGEPVFDRLDADIAHAMMSINAVKGVEIGDGFAVRRAARIASIATSSRRQGFLSNHAGGTLGGISSGQDIVVSMAIKPTSSIVMPGRTIDVEGQPVEIVTTGRHDPCVGIRAVPDRRGDAGAGAGGSLTCGTGRRMPTSARSTPVIT